MNARRSAAQATPVGAATGRQLRRLRLRVTGLITLLAAVAVTSFAVVAIRLDTDLRAEQLDADLLSETSRVASLITFTDGEADLPSDDDIGDEVVVGVRPPFDVFRILDEEELWGEFPELEPEEEDQLIHDIVDQLVEEGDGDTLGWLLELEEPLDDFNQMHDMLLADPPEELTSEAYRRFLNDVAEERGIELPNPVQVHGTIVEEYDTESLTDAVHLVADDDADVFSLDTADGPIVGRGVPIRDGAEVRGAVVAFGDESASVEDHNRFRNTLLGVGALLVLFSAGAAWFVAGRTIRPAAAALGQQERFLADAAHELRTPIAAIRATAEAPTTVAAGAAGLGQDAVDPDRWNVGVADRDDPAGRLDRVAELAADAGRLTDDLLTLARMDAERLTLQTEPVRLDLLVEALIDGDPAYVLEAAESVVEVDPGLIERAVGNLLANARNHGGASSARPALVTVADGTLRVHDQGPGVPPAARSSIFERFSSGPHSSGHGLGLPLARWIAVAHGGELALVTTRPDDVGAAFELRLPPARGH